MKVNVAGGDGKKLSDRDELYEAAIDVVIRERRGSVSLLQRSLGIGYGRAARLIDFMEEDGIVGPYKGSQAREILMTLEQWEQRGETAEPAAPSKPSRSNKILMPPAEPRMSPGTIRAVKPVADEGAPSDDGFDEENQQPPFAADDEETGHGGDEEEPEEEEPEEEEQDEEEEEDEEIDEDEGGDELEDELDEEDPEEEEEDEEQAEDEEDEAEDSEAQVEERQPAARRGRKRWKAESA